jgi:uncharacterized protein involved in type VI secretion and phage assembly
MEPQPALLEQVMTYLRSRFFGKYRGIVDDNADPAGNARLLVRVPAVLGDISVWAMPCVPYAGAGVGLHLLPEPGTGVWVEFEAGDLSFPIWTGFFWGDGEVPEGATATLKILKTEKHRVALDDAADEIAVENSSAASVVMTTDIVAEANGKVTIGASVTSEAAGAKVDVGAAGVTCDSGGTGKVEVTKGGVTLDSGAFQVA